MGPVLEAYTNARELREQTKTIEVSAEALASGSDANLPPLMNPTILEASDDLTNLSHLNEPAGEYITNRLHDKQCFARAPR